MVNDSPEELKNQLNLKDLELNSLLEITQAINTNMPEEALYKIYHFTLIANLNIKKLALFVLDGEWECKVNYGTEKQYKHKKLTEEILAINRIANIKPNTEDFGEFDIVIPVAHKSNLLAYILIGGGEKKEELNMSFVQTFTNIIIVAIENKKLARKELAQQALRRELEIAKDVQSFLFPKNLPDSLHVEIKSSYYPHDSIGGDYYDYIKLDEDSFIVCIADVSGKGIPAALLMSNFQASLRILVRHNSDLKQIIKELNQLILENAKGERFITFFIALINTKEKTVKYINAGHNPPIFISNKEIRPLDKGTTILGVFNKLPTINEQEIKYSGNSMLFAYTDGLTETSNEESEEYGIERLEKYLTDNYNLDLEKIHSSLYEELNKFRGTVRFPDDITYLSCIIS